MTHVYIFICDDKPDGGSDDVCKAMSMSTCVYVCVHVYSCV